MTNIRSFIYSLLGCVCLAFTRAMIPITDNQPAAGPRVVPVAVDTIDLSKFPISEKPLAAFPIFAPPAGVTTLNKPITREFDRLFFPTKEGMILLEGTVYKTFLISETGKEWSLAYVEKNYRDLITAAGGLLIFQGKVSPRELDKIKDEATYFGEEGSIDYPNNPVKVYAIRRKDGDHVFVQLSGNSAGAAVQILQFPKVEVKH